jgi:hypothetical protein
MSAGAQTVGSQLGTEVPGAVRALAEQRHLRIVAADLGLRRRIDDLLPDRRGIALDRPADHGVLSAGPYRVGELHVAGPYETVVDDADGQQGQDRRDHGELDGGHTGFAPEQAQNPALA